MTDPHNHPDTTAPADPSLDRFARSFQAGLPSLSHEAMQRIESAIKSELNRIHPPQPLPLVAAPAWPRWAAIAAMFILTVGFAWFVSTKTPMQSDPLVATRISDEFPVIIASEPPSTQVTAWDSIFFSIDRYASLLGIDRLARR